MLAKTVLIALLPFLLGASASPCKRHGNGGTTSGGNDGGSSNNNSSEGNNSTTAATGSGNLNDNCAPGGNFNLSPFTLQLPVGSPGKPTEIQGSQLSGCKGYQQQSYFYTESDDGAMVMKVPGSPASSNCVTTTNSKHCRTELRENGNWDPKAATNRLSATLEVPEPDDSQHGTVIGQIHIDDSVSSKPVCELYINKSGVLSMGVEQTRSGGDEKVIEVGQVNPGAKFSYEIVYENNQLSVAINGGSPKQLSTYSLDAPMSYFKAGNYNQGSSASDVKFYALSIQH